MTKKQQLYYLLEAFNQGEYNVPTFCQAFEEVFYPDVPVNELTDFELKQFDALAAIVVRFSPFEEDLKAYPKVYHTVEEVKIAIRETSSKLLENKRNE